MSLVVDRDVNALLIAYRRHGDTDARDQLLVDLMPLVRALASAHAYSTRSLQAPFDDEGEDNLFDKLGVEEQGYADVEDGSIVSAGLEALDGRERRIVELRFFDEMTQSQIAAELGISQMHVSRLLRRALGTMRGRIDEVMGDADE